MGTTSSSKDVTPRFTAVGDSVIARIDEEVAMRNWCPEHLEHLLERPADPDDAVAVLRWSVAWHLDSRRVDEVADEAGIPAVRLLAFMQADADRAGDVLTFTEAARLIRVTENRIEDRDLTGEVEDYRRIAQPYIEATGLHYGEALRRAREVRDAYRAANPDAYSFAGDEAACG